MPEEDDKILKYNHGEKSMSAPFVIYADLECLLEKMSTCHNSPEKSSTTKIYVVHLIQKISLVAIEAKIV